MTSVSAAPSAGTVRVIQRGGAGLVAGLRELWAFRELLFLMVWRDLRVRYKQTVLGAAWVVLQPLLTMVVFSVVFGRLAGLPSDGVPYPVFAYTALLPWQLFAQALGQATGSLVGSQHLIRKVYFPRLVIPLTGVLGGLVDFAVAFGVLGLLMAYYRIWPTLAVLTLPLFLLLAVTTALAAGLWLGALNVRYRDVRHVVPFLTQMWLFATPVAYSSSLVPDRWRVLYGLNPMAGVIEGFRWALLGRGRAPDPLLLVSVVVVAGLLVSGYAYFRWTERTVADVV